MKTTTFPTTFLFNPNVELRNPNWPLASPAKVRAASASLSLVSEMNADHKQEVICGTILVLCTLSGLATCIAQFVRF